MLQRYSIKFRFIIFTKKHNIYMDSYQEKIGLLQEMIGFALVDGELHDRE